MAKTIKMTKVTDKTFQDGYEEYLLDCQARNLREGTLKHYRENYSQISKCIPPDTPLLEMTKEMWDDYMVKLNENPRIHDVSMRTYARDLKTFLRFFMKKGYIPFYDMCLPKTDKKPIEVYSDAELQRLLKKPNMKKASFTEYKSWVICNFLLSTGIRRHSLINIKIKDIDLSSNLVYIRVTKNRKPLLLPLNKDIVAILKEYLQYRNATSDEDYLFCNVYGKKLPESTLGHQMVSFHKSRGIEKTGLHRYRHTFAKKWVRMGGNVVTLSKILGHSSLEITQNYLNILLGDVQEDIEEFNILQEIKRETITLKKRK